MSRPTDPNRSSHTDRRPAPAAAGPSPRVAVGRRAAAGLAVGLLLGGAALAAEGGRPAAPTAPAPAVTVPPAEPAPPAASDRPALEQLNRECVALYAQLQGSVLRVQLPAPSQVAAAAAAANPAANNRLDNRFEKYKKLNPDVIRRLNEPPVQQQVRANPEPRNAPAGGGGGSAGGNGGVPDAASTVNAAASTQPAGPGGNDAGQRPQQHQGSNASPGPSGPPGPYAQQRDQAADGPPAKTSDVQQQQTPQPPSLLQQAAQQPGQQPAQQQQQQASQQSPQQDGPSKPYTLIVPAPQNAAVQNAAVQNGVSQNAGMPNGISQTGISLNGANTDLGPQQGVAGNRGNAGWMVGNTLRPPADGFAGNQIGLLLNDQGDVLVPAYLERSAVGEQPVRLAVGDGGEPIEARFVGSDEQTQLTVLRCLPPAGGKGDNARAGPGKGDAAKGDAAATAKVAVEPIGKAVAGSGNPAAAAGLGKPVRLSRDRLADGTLVLVLSPADGAGRLTVWNAGTAREFGVVVTIDGRVAGVARGGQFLTGRACQLVADQIVRHGAVRRATLGVIVTQVDPADPVRNQLAEPADRPAVRVDQVIRGSAADRGGVRAGDLILSVAGEPVPDIASLAAAIAGRQGPAELRLLREGAVVAATVDLARR